MGPGTNPPWIPSDSYSEVLGNAGKGIKSREREMPFILIHVKDQVCLREVLKALEFRVRFSFFVNMHYY